MALLATAQLVSLDSHFPPLFRPGVLKWVISVIFGLFGLFCIEILSKGGCCHDSFALNLSLSGPLPVPPLTSVARGTLYFVLWWNLLYVPWSTLFYCGSLPWRFLLCLWGWFWMPGGHHCSWSSGCWAVCGWGRISSVHLLLSVGPAYVFSETKLEISFSTMSHCIFLAMTQSSKVLKWTLLVLYLISGVLKGIKFVTDLSYHVLGRQYFSSQTYPWSWKKSVCFCFWPNLCLEHVLGVLKGVNFCLCCSLLPRVPLVDGLEMSFLNVLFTADPYPVYMKDLEMSLKFCGYVLLWGLCRQF